MTVRPRRIVLIAAVARNGIIGSNGRLPWHLPGDLAHFRRETWGKPVILGRKTLVSIGRSLPGRSLIVLSHEPAFRWEGATTAPNLAVALACAGTEAERVGAPEIMVAGGGAVYAAALPHADELRLTLVDLDLAGDTRFPPIDPGVWHETERLPATPGPDEQVRYVFARYERRGTAESVR